MAKININFNDKNYSIDEQALSASTTALKSHLSTVMNGTGATINFGGAAYGVDSTKLTAAKNDFVTYLGTIAGNGHKVVVDGREYSIDSTKLAGAISELEAVLGGTGEERLEGDGAEYYTLAPTALSFRSTAPLNELQEIQINGVTVDPSNYTLEEGSTIVTFPIDYLKTLNVGSYEVSVASDSKTVKGDFTVAAPELNEIGFYYNQPYAAYVDAMGLGRMAVVLRDNGIANIIALHQNVTEECPYVIDGNIITVTTSTMGDIHCAISTDGIYCNELATNFVLNSELMAADNDYLYIYREDLGGYEVTVIDKTKSSYGAIKTGINGIDTVKLANGMFVHEMNDQGCSITNITIPDSVTNIGSNAFCQCELLSNVTFGENSKLDIIDSYAFDGCTSLTSMVIPNSVSGVGEGAFGGCESLVNIVFSNNMIAILPRMCISCVNLRNVVIPYGIKYIHNDVFNGCTSLTNIRFEGTMNEWNNITKKTDWNKNVPATEVVCSDGTVSLV